MRRVPIMMRRPFGLELRALRPGWQIVLRADRPRQQFLRQSGSRGAAACRVVELREAHPTGRQAVDVRRGDFAAVATGIGIAEIVSKNQKDVRPRRGRASRPRRGSAENLQEASAIDHIISPWPDPRRSCTRPDAPESHGPVLRRSPAFSPLMYSKM